MQTRRQFLTHVSTVGLATLAGCLFPGSQSGEATADGQSSALTDRSVTTTNSTCEDVNAGTISVDGNQLSITGTLVAPNACYEAQIAGVSHTEEVNRVNIHITPEKPDDYDACQQSTDTNCIAGVAYEASAKLASSVDRIVVTHRTGELTEVVARHTVATPTDDASTPSGSK